MSVSTNFVTNTVADVIPGAVLPQLFLGRSAPPAEAGAPSRARDAAGRPPARAWERRLLRTLVAADLAGALLAAGAGYAARFGTLAPGGHAGAVALAVLLALCWPALLALVGAYRPRTAFDGPREYRRVLRTGVEFAAGAVLVSYLLGGPASRPHLVLALGGAVGSALAARAALRWRLRRDRARGRGLRRVVAVGPPAAVAALAARLHRRRDHGVRVVAACVPGGLGEAGVPVLGEPRDARVAAAATGADTVVVLPGPGLDGPALRRLGWQLETDDVDLVLAPALGDVAGDRVAVRSVDGVALVHVGHPRLGGAAQLVKGVLDRALAAVALVAAAPVLLLVAALVRLDSAGPVLFRQVRIGRHGAPFTMLKFRTMSVDAPDRAAELAGRNDHDGVLFKLRADPRVTRAGRVLRRLSLDELPQLVNVLTGHMSLVGPRPPLGSEVARYPADMHRRLDVKPGLTGLWQVSGRSDLPWDEAVRLDLHYVDNWSLRLDLAILLRTVSAVLRGSGAY